MDGRKPRSLTLPEVRSLNTSGDVNESDIQVISWAYEVSLDEAREWFHRVPAGEALRAVNAIWEASGMTEAATFPGTQGDDESVSGG